jgi:hypothetical protein
MINKISSESYRIVKRIESIITAGVGAVIAIGFLTYLTAIHFVVVAMEANQSQLEGGIGSLARTIIPGMNEQYVGREVAIEGLKTAELLMGVMSALGIGLVVMGIRNLARTERYHVSVNSTGSGILYCQFCGSAKAFLDVFCPKCGRNSKGHLLQ